MSDDSHGGCYQWGKFGEGSIGPFWILLTTSCEFTITSKEVVLNIVWGRISQHSISRKVVWNSGPPYRAYPLFGSSKTVTTKIFSINISLRVHWDGRCRGHVFSMASPKWQRRDAGWVITWRWEGRKTPSHQLDGGGITALYSYYKMASWFGMECGTQNM